MLLTSYAGRGSTLLQFSGDFPMQHPSGSGATTHGGQIQPATGLSEIDTCYVSDLRVRVLINSSGTYACITGVNTATGTGFTGLDTEHIDMRVSDCELWGVSDIHVNVATKQRTYYDKCVLITSFDFNNSFGGSNIQHLFVTNSQILYRPYFDLVTTFTGTPVDTIARSQAGTMTLQNVRIGI